MLLLCCYDEEHDEDEADNDDDDDDDNDDDAPPLGSLARLTPNAPFTMREWTDSEPLRPWVDVPARPQRL